MPELEKTETGEIGNTGERTSSDAYDVMLTCVSRHMGRHYLIDDEIGHRQIEVLDLEVGNRFGNQYFLPVVRVHYNRDVMERICIPHRTHEIMDEEGLDMSSYMDAFEKAFREVTSMRDGHLERRMMEDYGAGELMPDGVAVARVSWDSAAKNVRYYREERMVGLRSNNIRNFMSGITFGDKPYFICQFIRGNSDNGLAGRIGEKTYKRLRKKAEPLDMSFDHICGVWLDLLEFLNVAKKKGIVHRDIKPDNVMVIREGAGYRGLMGDLGLAKPQKIQGEMSITGEGWMVGSPKWMAPEQAMGSADDKYRWSADMYSLGKTVYHWLSGGESPVPNAKTLTEVVRRVAEGKEEPIALTALPRGKTRGNREQLAGASYVLAGMMKMLPRERYQSIEDVMSDVSDIRSGKLPRKIKAVSADFRDGQKTPRGAVEGVFNMKGTELPRPKGWFTRGY